MTIRAKLIAERKDIEIITNMIDPPRALEVTCERLASQHGGIKVEYYREEAGGPVFAYVRARSGKRWTVNDWGQATPRRNNDMAPYEEEA